MSGPPPRKIPRIISRKPKQPDRNIGVIEDCNQQNSHDALVKELSNEKVVVKDGCLVAVQHIEKGAVHGIVGANSTHGGRRIIIDTAPSDQPVEAYTENPLPGVADEVESYPCKFCSDQVFLTSYGLERHGRTKHSESINEILMYIQNIKEEWERRERERLRLRERAMVARARQEGIAQAAVRSAQERMVQERVVNPIITAGDEISLPSVGTERFEACRICNILVNVKHPTAMENHLGAHKKNDQLRNHLLTEYGADVVRRLTCHECRLVFTDPTKLDAHMDSTHVRRRKFVCKYCGHLCMSMTELNTHKADIHAITPGSSSAANARSAHLMAMKQNQRQAQRDMSPDRRLNRVYRPLDDNVCSTSCNECGLRLVRPSLLVRHMLRVHSKDSFSCEVVTRGVPNIRIEVEQNRLSWWCCDQKYVDRNEFLYHRRIEHLEPMVPQQKMEMQTNSEKILQMATAHLPMQPGSSTYPSHLLPADDGTIRVMVPEGVDSSGEIFVMMVDEQEDHKNAYLREDMHEVHHDDVDGETETVQISVEQYEQLRQEYGDEELSRMIMFVNEEPVDETGDQLLDDPNIVNQDTGHTQHLEPELTNEEIFEP